MKTNLRIYSIIGLTQILVILLFILGIYFMYEVEKIILNPIPYTIGFGILVLVINFFILNFIFKKYLENNSDLVND